MSKIYYTPFDNALNGYTERMKSLLSVFGEVKRVDKNVLIKKISKLNFNDVIVVNWLENMMINEKGNISPLGVLKIFIIFICFRFMFKQFIYFRHNHYPHSCNSGSRKKAKFLLDLLERLAHITVVHSPVEANNGRIYVPHPLYNVVQVSQRRPKHDNRFIIFGSISRYKKIEKVISDFPENLSLLVVGKCNDSIYLEELNALIKSKNNIEIISDYISDEQARNIINSSNGLLITHNDDDMIVSGSFFYAMSLQAKVYVLETPFFLWAAKEIGDEYIEVSKNLDEMFDNILRISNANIKAVAKKPKDLFSDEIIIGKLKKIID